MRTIRHLFFALLVSFSLYLNASEGKLISIFMLSTVEEAKAARAMIARQDYQDGISEKEALTLGLMYWRQHKHEYRFLSGGLGSPEDQGENWYIPYHVGVAADRSNHGVLIHKLTGACSHPKLESDIGYMVQQNVIQEIDLFIANKLLENDDEMRLN